MATTPRPCGGLRRREFLAAAPLLPWALLGSHASAAEKIARPSGPLGVPGPYPGRVVEARNKGMIQKGVKNREAVKTTLARGMTELTGADDGTEAWRSFFEPGDVVGIKVVPNGFPQRTRRTS